MNPKIALVDDDRNILTSVSMALEAEGFRVTTYADGEAGLMGVLAHPVDLVVSDIKMPRLDGVEMLTRLRQKSQVPVIFLTSKDEEADQLSGLRAGADDYMTKPFSQRLLVERIRAILRRNQAREQTGESKKILCGDLALDEDRQACSWKGREVELTMTEFLLLRALAQRPGLVKSRDQLMDMVYSGDVYVDDRTVDSHIKRLRKKLRLVDPEFDKIETLYGAGYKYRED